MFLRLQLSNFINDNINYNVNDKKGHNIVN